LTARTGAVAFLVVRANLAQAVVDSPRDLSSLERLSNPFSAPAGADGEHLVVAVTFCRFIQHSGPYPTTSSAARARKVLPHEREAVWQLTPTSSIYVVQDSERAGSGLVTLALDDLDAHEKRLTADGFELTEQSGGASPRRLVIKDANGNRLTFFHDPS
jgi:hypothetical protein